MIVLNDIKYFTPKEIADTQMIVNRKGNGDYGFVLRLIKQGKLQSQTYNLESKIPYYLVPESEIEKYNNRFTVSV